MKKGFTLVELLAVIVILAVILIIAIPHVLKVIEQSRINAFESDAKMILNAIRMKKTSNIDFNYTVIDETNIKELLNINDVNYKSITITQKDEDPYIIIVGKNKWANLVVSGTTNNIFIHQDLVLWLDASNTASYPKSGSTWYDISGNENSGVFVNNPTFDNGAIMFNGVDDYIRIESSNDFNTGINGTFTYSAWIKSSDYSVPQTIISRTNPCSNPGHFNIFINNNKVHFSFYSNLDARGITHSSSNSILENDQWHHIVWTKQWGQLGVKLYVDGVLHLVSNDSDIRGTTYSRPVFIGARNRNPGVCESDPSPSRFFNGMISDIRVYNRILSEDEIKLLYESTK